MMFTLCRYLRDKNIDCHLFVFKDEPSHFLPQADSFDESYKEFTTFLNHRKEDFFADDLKETKAKLKEFDFFIGTDLAPAFLFACGIRLDVFIPHGSDIFKIPFEYLEKRPKVVNKFWWNTSLVYNSTLQWYGINNTNHVIIDDEYNRFNFKSRFSSTINYHSLTPPMLYANQYENIPESAGQKLIFANKFIALRKNYDFIIFSQSRHFWHSEEWKKKGNGKGNDLLIKAFARLVSNYPNHKFCMVLYEYGADVQYSKQLIHDLNIDGSIQWMPVSDRKEIMFGLKLADIACGEFFRPWFFCGAVNEALCLNKPLIHYCYPENEVNANAYPVLNSTNENHIFNHLSDFVKNPSDYKNIASNGNEWLIKHSVEPVIDLVIKLINENKKGKLNGNYTLQLSMVRFKIRVINFISRVFKN